MRLFIFTVVLLVSSTTYSCDVCGGMSGNTNIGLFASTTTYHQFGIRNNYRYFKTYLYGIDHSREHVFSSELFGRLQVAKKVQLLATIPFQYSKQKRSLGEDQIVGFGDPNVIINAILRQKIDSNGTTKSFLSAGLGAKFPFGLATNPDDELKNLYPGTGSFDFLFLLNHVQQFNSKIGIQSEASYVIKGTDKFDYRFGNSFLLQTQLVHRKKFTPFQLISTLGTQLDHQGASRLKGEIPEGNPNNSYILSVRGSVNFLVDRWLWSLSMQQPIYQRINLSSVEQKFVGTIGVFYFIPKKVKNETI